MLIPKIQISICNGNRLKDFQAALLLFIWIFRKAISTEITVASDMVDHSLGFEVHLPVLMCHDNNVGYKNLNWFKDGILIQTGEATLYNHFLSVLSLLTNDSREFDNILKLQGYYWCQTDFMPPSFIHRHLFRIKGVHTYAGKLFARSDSLGDSEGMSLEEKSFLKMASYEADMEMQLFGFLPLPNTFVTDIRVRKKALEVRFYLYVHRTFIARRPFDLELVRDQHELEYVLEYLNNKTSTDHDVFRDIADWLELKGIRAREIDLKSTLGCYEEKLPVPSEPPRLITWPGTRIGEIVIPEEACSSDTSLAVIRICTGSFNKGAQWSRPYGKCNVPASGLTLKLKNLHDAFGNVNTSTYIGQLIDLTDQPYRLRVTDLHLVVRILKELSQKTLNQQQIDGVFTVVDSLVETNRSQLDTAKSTIHLSSRILRVIENIMTMATERNQEIFTSTRHLLVQTKDSKLSSTNDHILGVAVTAPNKEKGLENSSIEFLTSGMKVPLRDSIAYFLLPPDLIMKKESDLMFTSQVDLVFFKEWLLFPNPKGLLVRRNYKVLPTPVMYVSISGSPAWNLTDPVQLYFKNMLKEEIEDPVCVYYDPRLEHEEGGWSKEGCEFGGLVNGFYNCRCHHMSIFAIILSRNPNYKHQSYRLGTSIYVGVSISIIALCLTVLLYILSKNWRSTADHSILFCLALSFLCCLIIIFISEMHFLWKPGCIVLSMIFHYSVISIFGWLLVQAVVYQLRFSKKTDVAEIPYFVARSAAAVWGIPIIIILIIWLSKEYEYSETCWKAMKEVSYASVIPVVVVITVTVCVYSCAAYALMCRFKKDFLIGESTYAEPVIKFRVAFTIFLFFVVSWLFGFFALHEKTKELRILFSICVTLTAYYVALFFIFHEISFWDLCRKCRKKEEPECNVVKYETTSYKATDDASATIQ